MRSLGAKFLHARAGILAGALFAAVIVGAALPAHAGFLDILFGGPQERLDAPAGVNSYAEPSAPTPTPTGPESVRSGPGLGRAIVFCVRLCDGRHFPLEHSPNLTPVETCRAMCPASKTKVFVGSEIDRAVARDGARYANLDAAFVYRRHLVSNCTCNGKDAFGLAPFDPSSDPTLRPGDIVATKDGFVAYAGKSGRASAFTPVDTVTVNAELNGGFSRVRLSRQNKDATWVDEAPGIIVPPQGGAQAARKSTTSSASDSEAVSPGDSIPNRLTSRGMPWAGSAAIMKSAGFSPGPVSLGRMPQ